MEQSPAAAQQAERNASSPVHVGTLDTAPFKSGWFDAVTMWDVIEHLQSPQAYIQQAARLLGPGGMLGITTPNIRSLAYKLLGRDWPAIGPNDHLYYFAPRTLARLLLGNGFAIHVMVTWGTGAEVWRRWLRYPALQRLAPWVSIVTRALSDRFLMGDEMFVIARRK